jgi:hypothetical protein
MPIARTTLPETIAQGQGGELAETAAAYRALNAVTGLLSGADLTNRDSVLIALGLPLLVLWTPGVGWGDYSQNPNLVRFFISAANSDATYPFHFNAQNRDIWFRLG